MKAAALLAFVFSLCGISYQFLLVRLLSPLVQDEALAQSVTLGVFLLGMGGGAALVAWKLPARPLAKLFYLEWILALLGALLVPLCELGIIFLELSSDTSLLRAFGPATREFTLAFFQPLALILGLLTGAELPLLSAWLGNRGEERAVTRILAFSYFGAIGGAFLVSYLLAPHTDLASSGLIISWLNLSGAAVICFLPQEGKNIFRALPAAFSLLLLGQGVLAGKEQLEQATMKTSYLELRLPSFTFSALHDWYHALGGFAPIERHQTAYQTVDLIPDRFLLSEPLRTDFAMYLNFQPQFSRESSPGYHESMALAPVALLRRPVKSALILGGGDGLLARELLRAGAEKIVMVELDPGMIRLAKEHPVLREMNGDSLSNPKVEVVLNDAFAFARSSTQQFDGIFADLPFPTSYDLLKLYSVEFYESLRHLVSEDGFLILDAPVWSDRRILAGAPRPWPQEILRATLREAGWPDLFAFGPIEPFLIASRKPSPKEFDYSRLPAHLSGRTVLNLAPIDWALEGPADDPGLVNFALRPRRIRW